MEEKRDETHLLWLDKIRSGGGKRIGATDVYLEELVLNEVEVAGSARDKGLRSSLQEEGEEQRESK